MLPAAAYMGLIYWLSSRPAPEFARFWPILFGVKLAHVAEYTLLTILLLWGLSRGTRLSPPAIAWTAAAVAVAWGVSDEIHQAFVPFRTAAATDALTDGLAALICAGVYLARSRAPDPPVGSSGTARRASTP
jgi:hypothetical protein